MAAAGTSAAAGFLPFNWGVGPNMTGGSDTGSTPGSFTPATSTAAPSSQAVNDLLGTIGQVNADYATAQRDTATAKQDQLTQQGDLLSQQGYAAEAGAYATAASIATRNSQIAALSGDIQARQEGRKAMLTESSTIAQTAANGFTGAGSSVYLMASNAQQGALAQQMAKAQGNETALGFQQQAAASEAEETAVGVAGTEAGIAAQGEGIAADEATTEAGQATTAGQASATNALGAVNALVANTGGLGAPNNTILGGINTSLTGMITNPGQLNNPILNYNAVPQPVQQSTFGGTTAVGPTGGALNNGPAAATGGGFQVVGANGRAVAAGSTDNSAFAGDQRLYNQDVAQAKADAKDPLIQQIDSGQGETG